jgi:hypothetical protein
VEVLFRLEPFRTPPVMARFMEGMDDAIRRKTGLVARIRCFGHAAPSIYALIHCIGVSDSAIG